MNPIRSIYRWAFAALFVTVSASAIVRADPYEDAIGKNFFMPELIMQTHEMIGLTDDQQQTLMAAVQDLQERMPAVKEELEKEKAALAEAVKGDKLDTAKVTAQAQKVMDLEAKAKLAQLNLLIKIKNTLTPEQQTKLRNLKGKFGDIQGKLKQTQALAKKWAESGGDPSSLQDTKDQLESYVKAGKMDEANALLDKTIKMLEEKVGQGK